MIEKWTQCFNFENYEISNLGRIRNSKKILSPSKNKAGYLSIPLRKNGKYYGRFIHRLVMQSFIGFSELQVNHKNGNKSDNSLENLEYVTDYENKMHSIGTGLRNLKYSRDTVNNILKLKNEGNKLKSISLMLNVPYSFVKDVSLGRTRKIF